MGSEVLLNLLSVYVTDVGVGDHKATLPLFVAVCELHVFGVEDAIQKLEIIVDNFHPMDLEAVESLVDSGGKIGHGVERGKVTNYKCAGEATIMSGFDTKRLTVEVARISNPEGAVC